jgi:hypothetical protein
MKKELERKKQKNNGHTILREPGGIIVEITCGREG